MGEENTNNDVSYYVGGTKIGNPIKQIQLYPVKNVLREHIKWIEDNQLCFDFYLKPRHWSRKKYKKYLMGLRYSRDYAERMCNLVSAFKGKISYNQMLFYSIIFGPDRG